MSTTATTVKKTRTTKVQYFSDIRAMLEGKEPAYGVTVETALAFIDHEVELLSKKSSTGNGKKQIEAREENKRLCSAIISYMHDMGEEVGAGVTGTFLMKHVPELVEMENCSNQKVVYLLKMLQADNLLVSKVVKGKVTFFLSDASDKEAE